MKKGRELLEDDRRLRDQLSQLQAQIGELATYMSQNRSAHHEELKAEIKALSSTVAKSVSRAKPASKELKAEKD